MGMMNYRKPKEELTVISCKKCGRAWQVTESDAKEFKKHKELCPECRSKSEKKKVSLLKRKTNFDRIKAMDIKEMSYMLMCPYNKCAVDCKDKNCIECTREWLESEAE